MSMFARGMLHVHLCNAKTEIVVASKAYDAYVYDRMMIETAENALKQIKQAVADIEATIDKAKGATVSDVLTPAMRSAAE